MHTFPRDFFPVSRHGAIQTAKLTYYSTGEYFLFRQPHLPLEEVGWYPSSSGILLAVVYSQGHEILCLRLRKPRPDGGHQHRRVAHGSLHGPVRQLGVVACLQQQPSPAVQGDRDVMRLERSGLLKPVYECDSVPVILKIL